MEICIFTQCKLRENISTRNHPIHGQWVWLHFVGATPVEHWVAVLSQDTTARLRREKTRQCLAVATTPFCRSTCLLLPSSSHQRVCNCPTSSTISRLPPLTPACWLPRWPVLGLLRKAVPWGLAYRLYELAGSNSKGL